MKKFSPAKNVVLATKLVSEGKIKVFPQTIINNLEEFNDMFATNFTYDSYSYDIIEYLRKIYNKHTFSDHSDTKHKSKEWFNNRFYPYSFVVDRR